MVTIMMMITVILMQTLNDDDKNRQHILGIGRHQQFLNKSTEKDRICVPNASHTYASGSSYVISLGIRVCVRVCVYVCVRVGLSKKM